MTEAMFDWLADDRAVHPLHIQTALSDFGIVLAAYMSALQHAPVALPLDPVDNLVDRLRSQLGEEATCS